jgi:hypothetical protein
LACHDKLFVNNPLDIKENDEHAPDFSLHLSCLLRSQWVWIFHFQLMLSSLNACLITAMVSVVLFQDVHKINAVPLLDPSWNRIRPDIRLQIKGCKKTTHPPNCVILYTDSQEMLVPSFTVASSYYNCYKDGSASPGNYGYSSY